MDKVEKRFLSADATQFRAVTDEDGKRYIEGYAAVTESRSKLLSSFGKFFYEEIERGAFEKVLTDAEDTIFVRRSEEHTSELQSH